MKSIYKMIKDPIKAKWGASKKHPTLSILLGRRMNYNQIYHLFNMFPFQWAVLDLSHDNF